MMHMLRPKWQILAYGVGFTTVAFGTSSSKTTSTANLAAPHFALLERTCSFGEQNTTKAKSIVRTQSQQQSLQPISFERLVQKCESAKYVIFGEEHGDPVAHSLEHELYTRLTSDHRKMALSLEFVDNDTEVPISPADPDSASKALLENCGNGDAYAPLAVRAWQTRNPVVAANAPRRFVSLVAREGAAALERLPEHERRHLPPLPLRPNSSACEAKLAAIFGEMSKAKDNRDWVHRMCSAQGLRDEAMAFAIFQAASRSGVPVFHVTGRFHCEHGLGITERLGLIKHGSDEIVSIVAIPSDAAKAEMTLENVSHLADVVLITGEDAHTVLDILKN